MRTICGTILAAAMVATSHWCGEGQTPAVAVFWREGGAILHDEGVSLWR